MAMPDSTERPNIVIIMTDQQRADFSRAEGFPLDTTPCIDRLGRQGVRFRRAYSTMPICAPARCSLFSGRWPKAHRVRENGGIRNMYCTGDLVDVLSELGYSINISGKNHSHLTRDRFDFASFYSHTGRHASGGFDGEPEPLPPEHREMDRWLKDLDHGVSTVPTPFPLECQPPCRVVSDAIRCLEARDDRPFFLWLTFAEPHNPYQVPEPYFSLFPEEEIPERAAGPEVIDAKGGKWRWMRDLIENKRPGYDAAWRRYRANYCGMLRLLDDQIGRFLGYLDDCGVRDDTLIVFTADHGDYAGDYGLQRKGVEIPECLIRIPLIFAGPRIISAGKTDFSSLFVSLADVMPTLCEALGVPLPDGVQGRSLWPLLCGKPFPREEFQSVYAEHGFGGLHYTEDERPELHYPYEGPTFDELNSVTQSGTLEMVRMGPWKLEYDMMGRGRLYDVEKDPAELTDLYHEPGFSEVKARLLEELLKWSIRTEDDLPHGSYVQKKAERNWYAAAPGAACRGAAYPGAAHSGLARRGSEPGKRKAVTGSRS